MMILEWLKAVLYGIVEGITEWLPVSSTGHLILLQDWLPFRFTSDPVLLAEFGEMFEVVIQLGAILAVVILFWGKLWPFSKKKTAQEKRNTWSIWLKVVIASIPAAFVGIVLDKVLEVLTSRDINDWLYNSIVVATMLIVYGVAFILIEHFHKGKEPRISSLEEIDCKTALYVGLFQALSIVPGTSRSGSTILGARLLGISRPAAAEFSFFLGIPVMAGASLLKGYGFFDYICESGVQVPTLAWAALAAASLVAFAVSMAAIRFLMDFVKRHSFAPFGVYRIILGALVLLYFIPQMV